MLPFVILLLVPMLLQHVVIGRKNINYEKKNKAALMFFFVFLTVMLMFRHKSVGNDTVNYMRYFVNFAETGWGDVGNGSLEIGFAYFNKIISVFSKDPQFFLAVIAIVISALIYKTYRRLCTDSSLTIVIFCTMSTFVMMFSGLRQMLAIAIGFIAYKFTKEKKLILFIITVIVAITFHASAFMLFFMYPIYHVKITKKWLIFIIPILGFVFIFNRQIFSILTMIINYFTRFEGQVSSTGAFTMLLLFVIFAVFAFVIPDDSRLDEEAIGMRNFLLFSVVLQMFAPLHMLAMRMNYYYIIFIPLLMPKIIECRSERWSQVAVVGRHVMVIFFLLYFFAEALSGRTNLNVFPYHFFWEAV